jgi:iron complex outermembrane recepter protein
MTSRCRWFEVMPALFTFVCGAGTAWAQQPPAAPEPPPPAAQPAPPAPEAPPAPAAAPEAGQPPVPAAAPGAEEAGAPKMGEEIVVTGSRVPRKDLNTPAPVTVMTKEQWQQSGKLTIGEFLQSLPEQGNAPNFQLNNGGATYTAQGATNVSLRSLGVTRTLVLLNGRRVVPSGLGIGAPAAVDLGSIPPGAVERIEVLKDGASAVYGSDAIAGVVNVITRKSYNGTEATAQYGISGHGDAQTFDAQVTTGRSGAAGNFLFSAGWFDQKQSMLRDRSWSAHALTYDYANGTTSPGGSFRTPQGIIGLPQNQDGSPVADCSAGTLCRTLVNSDPSWASDVFVRDPSAPNGWRVATNADRYNFAAENYLTVPTRRLQLFTLGDTKFSQVRGYYEASYVQRTSQQNAAPMPLNPGDYTLAGSNIPISVSKDSFYNPFGVDLPFAGRRLVEFGRRTYSQDQNTFRITTGLDGTLPQEAGPVRGWFWDTSLNYGRTQGTFTTKGAIRNSRIADAVGPSFQLPSGQVVCGNKGPDGIAGTADDVVVPNCVPLNLFGGPNNGSIDPAQIDGLGFTGVSRAEDALFTVDANTAGPLFDLGAGRTVSLALGYQYRHQSGAQIADPIAASGDSADFNFKSTEGSFQSNELYAELALPILTDVPGAKSLEANVAGRFVNYSTFGSKFTYKLGTRYTPIEDVTVRGTFGTSFRAPSISELYLGQSETAPNASDPCNAPLASLPPALANQCRANGVPEGGTNDTGNQELTHIGGNSKLKAETAQVWTAGVVVQPQILRDLSVTVDYYNVFVDNLVGHIGTAAIINGCFPGSSGTPQFCDLITRTPLASGGRILFVTDVNENVGQLRTSGIDFAIRYTLRQPFGRFGFALNGTWLNNFDRKQTVGTVQTIHSKGTFDLTGLDPSSALALPAWKWNLGATWGLGGFSAAAIARYIGNFKECAAADFTSDGGLCSAANSPAARNVGSNVTVDLNAGYALAARGLGKTTLVVGVNNVFDQKPQYVYSAVLANSDPSTYDFVGRFVYTRLQQTF